MPDELEKIWNFVLLTGADENVLTLGQLIGALVLLIVGYIGSRLVVHVIGKRLAQTKLRQDAIHIIKRVVFYSIIILISLSALSLLGIPLGAFAFATGAIAIGVGFGGQNIINNFISGWILMAERPIRIDDFIEIDDSQGTVEKIGNRSTRVRRTDGVHLLVPNSQLLERTVVNWTLVDQEIRTIVRIGVEYGSPPRLVADLMLQAVTEQPEVKDKPAASIVFDDFGDNALIFDAYLWCDVSGERALRDIRSAIRFRVCELFEANNIVVAFPQRDIHLDSKNPLEIRMINSESDS